jgi:hypothetical protein
MPDKTIALLNIEHFRKLLAEEMAPEKRDAILRLLAEEEEKLRQLGNGPDEDQS